MKTLKYFAPLLVIIFCSQSEQSFMSLSMEGYVVNGCTLGKLYWTSAGETNFPFINGIKNPDIIHVETVSIGCPSENIREMSITFMIKWNESEINDDVLKEYFEGFCVRFSTNLVKINFVNVHGEKIDSEHLRIKIDVRVENNENMQVSIDALSQVFDNFKKDEIRKIETSTTKILPPSKPYLKQKSTLPPTTQQSIIISTLKPKTKLPVARVISSSSVVNINNYGNLPKNYGEIFPGVITYGMLNKIFIGFATDELKIESTQQGGQNFGAIKFFEVLKGPLENYGKFEDLHVNEGPVINNGLIDNLCINIGPVINNGKIRNLYIYQGKTVGNGSEIAVVLPPKSVVNYGMIENIYVVAVKKP